jgi:CO dehydrogenase maturation factor
MTITIAFAGKGGTGKTTIAALLTNNLIQHVSGPLLAIDADPSTNLHLALGLPMPATVGDIREDMADNDASSQLGIGISRVDYLKREIHMVLEEGEKIDLLAMGRPEGQGCYCAANHMLRSIIDDLAGNYQVLIIDNEAGMEHISRRTTRDVDVLIIVTDPTLRGVKAAESILEMSRDLEINVDRRILILNRVVGELPQPLQEAIDNMDVELGAVVPADPKINELDALGQPLINLNGEAPAQREISKLTDKLLETLLRIPTGG